MENQTKHNYDDLPVLDDHQLIVTKVLAMVVLGLGSFLLGLAPLKITKWWRTKSFSPSIGADLHQHQHLHPGDSASDSPIVSRLLCFGGGVLLSTTFLHLQPEVREIVSGLQHAGLLPSTENLADMLFCAGFFMVFLVDEFAHTVLDLFYASRPRALGARETVLHRSISLCRQSQSISSSVCSNQIDEVLKEEFPSRNQQERNHQNCHRYHVSMQCQPNGSDTEKHLQHQVRLMGGSNDNNSLRGLFTVLALSFHEIFEGMAVGLEKRVDHVWYLFLAVTTHKLVIAFCIGLEFAWSGTRRFVLVVYVASFAVVTPIGIAFGMVIMHYSGTDDYKDGSLGPVAAVLQGLAAGTLLYVVFFEVLARHKQSGWSHLLSILFGFGFVLVLQMLTHHHHGHLVHSHDHCDHGHGHKHGEDHDYEHVH